MHYLRTLLIGLAVVAGLGSAVGRARADASLDQGLGNLAANVSKFMKDEGLGSAIAVGDFIAPPRLQASGGRGLSEAIAAAFKKQGMSVDIGAPVQLMGKFSLRDEKENDSNDFESVALRLRAEVLDKNDEVLQAFNISVFGDAGLQVAGGTVELPPNLPEEKRQEEIKSRLETPQAAIVGAETRAAANSPYGVEVCINRLPRGPQLVGGRSFCPLEPGEEYIIRLHNRSPLDAAVTMTIDGLSMFSFSREGNFGSQVVIPAGRFVEIPGWFITKDETAAFVITGYPDSAAGGKGVTTGVGTITATFAACWDPSVPPPSDEGAARGPESATGLGRPIEKRYEEVKRVIGNRRAVISVRYNRSALKE